MDAKRQMVDWGLDDSPTSTSRDGVLITTNRKDDVWTLIDSRTVNSVLTDDVSLVTQGGS